MMCRVILGNSFKTPEDAIECCESLKITNHSGVDVLIKDYFVEGAFEKAVTHLWNTRKVYVEELGYVLYTSPFTIRAAAISATAMFPAVPRRSPCQTASCAAT